jgi:hypothetical protein
MEDVFEIRLDKTKISFSDSFDDSEEREYWWSRTPQERLLHVERLRRIAYGYDEDSPGLQRVLEIIERK